MRPVNILPLPIVHWDHRPDPPMLESVCGATGVIVSGPGAGIPVTCPECIARMLGPTLYHDAAQLMASRSGVCGALNEVATEIATSCEAPPGVVREWQRALWLIAARVRAGTETLEFAAVFVALARDWAAQHRKVEVGS